MLAMALSRLSSRKAPKHPFFCRARFFAQNVRNVVPILSKSELQPVPEPSQSIIPKEVNFGSQKDLQKLTEAHIASKTPEQLFRQKFDLTPPSNEEFQQIADNSLAMLKLLSLPQQPSQVTKHEKITLKAWEKDLGTFLNSNGATIQAVTRWVRGMCHDGHYEAAYNAVATWRVTGPQPDTILYNSLLTGLNGKSHQEVKSEAEKILATMKEDNITPNSTTYATIIHAMVDRRSLTPEELDDAFAWVTPLKAQGLTPTVELFTSLVVGCVRAGDPTRAWATFDHMRVWYCEPDFVMFTEMMNVCGMTGETERALDLFDEMKSLDIYPTEVTFTALLGSFRNRPDMFREGLGILNEMKHVGYKPDIRTWKAVLDMIASGGDKATAELVFDEAMREFQNEDNKFSKKQYLMGFFEGLLRAYATSHRALKTETHLIEVNIKQAESLFNKIQTSEEIKPTVRVANAMLEVYCEAGRLNRALSFKESFSSMALVPNADTFAILIKMFSRTRRLERAFDLLNQMKVLGMKPSLKTYSDLITACARSDFVMSGMRLLREMKEKGYPLAPHHYFVLNFRRNLSSSPHLIREIDDLTGKALHHVPGWKKPGGRHQRPDNRPVSKKERKAIAKEPVWLSPGMIRRE